MSLHNGLDIVAIATHGTYTATYGVGEEDKIAVLFSSRGLLEDVPYSPPIAKKAIGILGSGFRGIINTSIYERNFAIT